MLQANEIYNFHLFLEILAYIYLFSVHIIGISTDFFYSLSHDRSRQFEINIYTTRRISV